jgi:hypothetical protein
MGHVAVVGESWGCVSSCTLLQATVASTPPMAKQGVCARYQAQTSVFSGWDFKTDEARDRS